MTLVDEATTYLKAEGWTVNPNKTDAEFISATRAGFGGGTDQVFVWCPTIDDIRSWRTSESGMLRRFESEAGPGQKFLLVESREGLSSQFQRAARADHNVQIRAPIQFFDAPFKWDAQAVGSGIAASSAASQLHSAGADVARRRTPQPYRDLVNDTEGPDLLRELVSRFATSTEWTRPVILVTAPAGFGKSMLFSALYAELYKQFHGAKRAQQRARRPLPLLPEYVAGAAAPTLRGLVEAFIQADIARPIPLPAFEWMMTRGYASWLLDGLDELISRDLGFFEYIVDILTRQAPVAPRILICVRDSLLSASQGLRDFLGGSEGLVQQYRLLPWDRTSISTFARMRLRDRDRCLTEALDSESILRLCGTPYYAELLARRVETGEDVRATSLSEIELLGDAVESIVSREYEKDLLSENVVSKEDVLEVVQEAAVMEIESGTRGISVDDISDLAELVLPMDLDEESRDRVENQMVQLSVFQQASERGRVRFAQDVIFEYLIGKRAAQHLRTNPVRFSTLLSWQRLPPDSVALRVLRTLVAQFNASEDLQITLSNASASPIAFVNILQVILGMPNASDMLREVSLERQDLSGITFSNLRLDGVSLRGANLEATHFDRCDLSGCDLAEANLHMTRFTGCGESLSRANFGTLVGFVSARVDSEELIDSVDDFLPRIGRGREGAEQVLGPCPTAMQLRVLFLKFIRPNGQARRDWLDDKAVLAGRRYVDPGVVVNAAEHAGFLIRASGRARYERARGELYADMVGFVRALQITTSIRSLLQDTCRIPSCAHIAEL